jgi:hypothetical protein
MYGLTRATLTLIGVAVAGVLLWLATQVLPDDLSGTEAADYWTAFGLVALAGLVMALSQLLGGWTKWGWPRVSGNVFLLAFLPALLVGGWVVAFGEPEGYWLGDHIRRWSDDIGVDGLVADLSLMIPAIAFGVGLVFGLTFDTTGPRVRAKTAPVPAAGAQPVPSDTDGDGVVEDRRVHISHPPEPEPAPTAEPPEQE